jgi:gas vesicle protein
MEVDVDDCEELGTMENKLGTFRTLLRGILIGGLIGAGIALLTTPQSGPETRAMIRSKAEEVKGRALETADQTRIKAEEIKQRGEEVINQQKANVIGTVEGVKEGVRTYKELNQSGKTSA